MVSIGRATEFSNWLPPKEKNRQAEENESEILAILDSAYANDSTVTAQTVSKWESASNGNRNRKEKVELLIACTIDRMTELPGEGSFTRALIDASIELLVESGDRSFSTFQFNQRIALDKRRYEEPS
ncbi:uncharacterized protein CC84DRAFT_1178170 [Paraphaeosphaeria sporulosa]|uniref:Uncharacterized protein n=1 Tax=Paraphaeosphaeria sporulosa TaxID=1460663 RepID=A0A177C6N8_9PLEO|nr:uncharacterized protein CC84DRAFT_1178170 [Paraphaeosphaeria sporulosa]OAG02532.1 hypothetical protein CC84DRAFT_1178170 [Paraphaeosphaeria sporulosa]